MRRATSRACGTNDNLVILEGWHGCAIGERYTKAPARARAPGQPTAVDFATAALADARARGLSSQASWQHPHMMPVSLNCVPECSNVPSQRLTMGLQSSWQNISTDQELCS